MDYSLNQVESLPESFIPGGVYFDKETGGVYVAQDSSTKKQFGGTVTGISSPQPAGPFTASNPGVNAIQKVSNTSSQGSTNVITSIVYINGAKLVAMGDGDTISYGGSLYSFLQSNLVQGKLFMLSTTDPGDLGFGGRPVTVELQGNTFVIFLVSSGTPHNKIIHWTVTSSNQVTRNDTIITVDSTLSTTSTNPVQNKVVKEALDGKQGKFSHGGTLQVSSINGNTALSVGNVDAKADYVEVQYTGSSNATFDFNSKFSASWFADRTNKPQRMLFRNNSSSGTVTITTSGNSNFSYSFIKVTIPASSYVEFLVYKSIVAVTANSNKSNPLKGAIIETGHEAVCLSLSLKESGTIPSSDLAKLKEDKSRIPLFYYDGNNSNLLFPATYNWNGTKLYVQLIEPQPDNFRLTSVIYSSSGVWESKKNIALDFSGNGTKFLNDNGVYAAVPGPHVVAHGVVSADGTVTFYYGEGQMASHTTGVYRLIVTGGLIGRILLAFPMQDGFYLSQAALSGGMHTITTYKNGTKTNCGFCFIVYAMN